MPELDALINLFYPSRDALGEFSPVVSGQLPETYRILLAHDDHMTVTLEAFHNSHTAVEALASRVTDTHYARVSVLRRQRDQRAVQFAIFRLKFCYVPPAVRQAIQDAHLPLGRILILYDVLRHVELVSLWRIRPSAEILRHLPTAQPPIYGRTAIIYCNGEPAVEVLEIVTAD